MGLSALDSGKGPENCIACHSCEKVCPQTIHIPDELHNFTVKIGRA
jgi:hypothetical protein